MLARELDQVYRYLPGELAPKLALAHAVEQAGDHAMAAAWFDIVSSVDPGLTSAVFGLARARSAMGDRRGAVAAYERIPHSSGAYQAAQIAEVDLLLTDDRAGADLADVRRAAAIVEACRSIRCSTTASPSTSSRQPTTRSATTERPSTRRSRSSATRSPTAPCAWASKPRTGPLARHAPTSVERIALVDQANRVRPWSWWVRSGR